MAKLQELQIKQSEIREKLNGLLDVETRTAEQDAELVSLTAAAQKLEPELRGALVADASDAQTIEAIAAAGGAVDPETRERLELRSKATFGGFLRAALQGRIASGADAEYAAAFKAPPGEVPIDLWESDRPRPETRAATPAPATGQGATLAQIQPFVFSPSIAPRLGIDMPSVGSGSYSEMTISTALPAAPKAKGGDADDTAGVLTPLTANPRSIRARMSVTLEDVAQIGQSNFEAALRSNVSMALSDEYDDQAINGNSASPNINGLVKQLTDPANPTVVANFDAFVAAFANQIDGLFSSTMRDIAIVANVAAYKLSAKTFRDRVIDTGQRGGVSLGDVSFADYAQTHTGGWWTNKRMPNTASTIARGIVYRMGRPGLRTACHPTWGTIAIDDIYTSSRSGQRHFTVHALVGDKVLIVQPDAYDLVEFKVA